ncbi:MAG: carboxypeptidase-like regulatory domain-containing protein [Lewinellaceae bacterium]|nr:carboxypeptidase-like regulatory domain-containing protein [Lewinellaceae bacterium]
MKKVYLFRSSRPVHTSLGLLLLLFVLHPAMLSLGHARTFAASTPVLNATAAVLNISGRVTDDAGAPLIGATIKIKGTTLGAVTDAEGRFFIRIPEESMPASAVLLVSYTGYVSQEVALGGRTEINFILAPDTQQLGELVVIGYGTQSKKT